jgi:hypothetical protein
MGEKQYSSQRNTLILAKHTHKYSWEFQHIGISFILPQSSANYIKIIFLLHYYYFFCLTGLLSLVSDTTAADLSLMGFNSGERLNFIFWL